MEKKTLTLNIKRNKDAKPVDKVADEASQGDPQKRFLTVPAGYVLAGRQ